MFSIQPRLFKQIVSRASNILLQEVEGFFSVITLRHPNVIYMIGRIVSTVSG
jgi:hypothetical protein